ncbi:hypothetical protein AN237_00125 [Raoultella ornithinolytica]|nr:hypothetical protein AN237_00125 [Raoultella ornithinolytica]
MSFLRWFAREGFRTLKYVFRGIFRSLLRYVPCTMHPPLFSHPLRVNGMAGVSLAPMPPGIALKTAAARYAPLRLHLADRAGLTPPVSTYPLAALQGGYLLPSPNSQTAETKVSRRDDFPVAMPAKPALGRSPAAQETEIRGTHGERNIPPFWQQQTLAPTTVYRHRPGLR